jgi:xanthine dehydrogenase molybdopterin-binding subunit B
MPPSDAVLEAPLRHVYKPLPHDSGAKHVQGSAEYIDDMPEPVGTNGQTPPNKTGSRRAYCC